MGGARRRDGWPAVPPFHTLGGGTVERQSRRGFVLPIQKNWPNEAKNRKDFKDAKKDVEARASCPTVPPPGCWDSGTGNGALPARRSKIQRQLLPRHLRIEHGSIRSGGGKWS
jgi:hypothetical protein